jgi:beta-galactosidase beta subunit
MIKAARDLTENAAKMQSEASAARRRALTQKGKYRIEGHDSFSNESYNIGFTDDLEYARFFI